MRSLRPLLSIRHASTKSAGYISRLATDIEGIIAPPSQSRIDIELNESRTTDLLYGRPIKASESKRENGFFAVSSLLQHPLLSGATFADLQAVVRADPDRRLEVVYDPHLQYDETSRPEVWWVRMKRGHVQVPESRLRRITPETMREIPIAMHVTTASAWKVIEQQGLSRKSPSHTYIHFHTKVPNPEVLHKKPTGSRSTPKVSHPEVKMFIVLDLKRAIKRGLKFYHSKRDDSVLLTTGNDMGFIPPEFFKAVQVVEVQRKAIKLDGRNVGYTSQEKQEGDTSDFKDVNGKERTEG